MTGGRANGRLLLVPPAVPLRRLSGPRTAAARRQPPAQWHPPGEACLRRMRRRHTTLGPARFSRIIGIILGYSLSVSVFGCCTIEGRPGESIPLGEGHEQMRAGQLPQTLVRVLTAWGSPSPTAAAISLAAVIALLCSTRKDNLQVDDSQHASMRISLRQSPGSQFDIRTCASAGAAFSHTALHSSEQVLGTPGLDLPLSLWLSCECCCCRCRRHNAVMAPASSATRRSSLQIMRHDNRSKLVAVSHPICRRSDQAGVCFGCRYIRPSLSTVYVENFNIMI